MALNRNSSEKIEELTKVSVDEESKSELKREEAFHTAVESDVNTDAFYVELLNENSNDSKISSVPETNEPSVDVQIAEDQNKDNDCSIVSCESECNEDLKTTVSKCIDNANSPPKDTSEEIMVSKRELSKESFAEQRDTFEKRQHHDSESWTEDSDSSSSSDSDFFEEMHNSITPKTATVVKTKGELDLEDLPPIEDLHITVEEKELVKIGKIHAIVTKQVVVLAEKEQKPLDLDSVLFLSHDKPLGRIFDVFGPVSEPFYIIRFNSPEDINNKGVTINAAVYFAPEKKDITSFVFVDVLRLQKGSDASWKDNNEPPEEFLDYSDDEQERMAKQKRRGKNRDNHDLDVQIISSKKPHYGTKSVPVVQSNNVFNNYKEQQFRPQGQSFQPRPRNPFRRTYYAMNNERKFESPYATNNRASPANAPTMDEVPVWITSPPSFFQPTSSTSGQNMSNTMSSTAYHNQQQNQNFQQTHHMQHAPSYSPIQQIRPAQLVLMPKQPYIPQQPQAFNSMSNNNQTQTQLPGRGYFINPPRPLIQQQTIDSQSRVIENLNQPHSYRPLISTNAPVLSGASQSFQSHGSQPSTGFLPTNFQTFAASPISFPVSNTQFVLPNQAGSPFTAVQSQTQGVQLNTQVPSFPPLPPFIKFEATQSCPIPPPQPSPGPTYNQYLPNQSRF